jgi:Bacterial Ig domain
MKTLILWFALLTCGISCSKDAATANDRELPAITFSSPTTGQVYAAGQAINISGTITDNNYIAEVHIHVTNINTSALLMDVHLYPGASTTTFSQSITAVAGVNYKILVTAKDKAVNEGRNSIEVSCN